MPQRTEQEIMRNWKYMDPPLVSVCCITYNHEPYIRDAIEGFLMQETDFPFEVIIHDDASTDKTAEIVREYAEQYPQIIKPIFQTENQYSKGVGVSATYVWPRAQGEYIALCEGDDYWTDPKKLQVQANYLQKDHKCTFCFHNAYLKLTNTTENQRLVVPWMPENRSFFKENENYYSAGELQLLGFIPTASFFFPKYVIDNLPDWFLKAPVGDNPLKLLASHFGYAYFMEAPMCIYRLGNLNSATTKWRDDSKEKTIKRCEAFIKMIESFDAYSNYTYSEQLEYGKIIWNVPRLMLLRKIHTLGKKQREMYLQMFTGFSKMKPLIKLYLPFLFLFLKKIKYKNPLHK